jgi:hypothetical protein
LWHGYLSNEGKLSLSPALIMKYQYEEDILIIRSTNFKSQEKAYGIIPIDKRVDEVDVARISIPEYSSPTLCASFIIHIEKYGRTYTPCFLYEGWNNQDMVFIKKNIENYYEVSISIPLIEMIEAETVNFVNNNPPI